MSFQRAAITPSQQTFLNSVRSFLTKNPAPFSEPPINHESDWEQVFELATYHGVIPAVRSALCRPGQTIPEHIERRLNDAFFRSAASSLSYTADLAQLRLHEQGFRSLAFKGPALGIGLFGKASLRHCRDLDILVPKRDVPKAREWFYQCGYRLDDAYVGKDDALTTDKHLLFVNQDTGTKLELHWAIALPKRHFQLDFDSVWGRREDVQVCQTPVAVPGPRDLLMMLCVHGASHYWSSLKWACDIAAFLTKYPDLDWTRVRTEAKRLGCWRMLLIGVSLGRDLAGCVLPKMVEIELSHHSVRDLCAKIQERTFSMQNLSPMNSRHALERLSADITCRERSIDRVRIAGSFIRAVIDREIHKKSAAGQGSFLAPLFVASVASKSWRNVGRLILDTFDCSRRSQTVRIAPFGRTSG